MPSLIAHSATEFKFGDNVVQKNFLQPYVAMALNANQALANDTNTLILFNRTIYDEFNTYNSSDGTFTIPLAGLYCVSMFCQTDEDGKLELLCKVGNNTKLSSNTQQSRVKQSCITGFIPLAANDQIRMFINVEASNVLAKGDANIDKTGISIWRVGEKA